MNLVDRLLKADVKKADELETGVFNSKRLAKVVGEDGTAEVKIREIKARRLNDILSMSVKDNGKTDLSKAYDAKVVACIEGCVDPDLRNKDLQGHFGCTDARSLCEKLFGFEVNTLSDAIVALSTPPSEDEEEEIKN